MQMPWFLRQPTSNPKRRYMDGPRCSSATAEYSMHDTSAAPRINRNDTMRTWNPVVSTGVCSICAVVGKRCINNYELVDMEVCGGVYVEVCGGSIQGNMRR